MHLVTTTTEDGLHLRGLLSETPDRKTIIVHIHGMAGGPYENAWYEHFHRLYPEQGYAFLVGQHRGTGSVTQFARADGTYPNYGDALELFEESVYDIDAWVQYARGLGYERIILQAHSFGPSKAVYSMQQRPDADIAALVLISPVDMLGATLVRGLHDGMLAEAQALHAAGNDRTMLSTLLDGELYISAQTYLNLFTPGAPADVFSYTDRAHDWSSVEAVRVPVLLIGGTEDHPMTDVAPTDVAFEALRTHLANSPRVETQIYDGARHDFAGFEDRIVQDVVAFMSTK